MKVLAGRKKYIDYPTYCILLLHLYQEYLNKGF
jgi:hypothetical protein